MTEEQMQKEEQKNVQEETTPPQPSETDGAWEAKTPQPGVCEQKDVQAVKDPYAGNIALIVQAQAGDDGALEKLVVGNMGLVHSVAVRFSGRGVEIEDLNQIGIIGMMKAIRSFDVSRGNAFSTYAVPLIIGEIRRHLRDNGMMKVSRTYKKLGASLMREKNRIMTEEGRDVGIEELANRCGASTEEAAMALDAITPITSLSDPVFGEDSTTYEGVIADESSSNEAERICDRVALAQIIARMPPLWRKIVLLRYYRDLTQSQTAALLGLTQVKVSREEKKIVAFLRAELVK